MLLLQNIRANIMDDENVEAFYIELGELIHKARNNKNLSQAKVADFIGLSRASIVNIEKGRQRTPLHQLYSFAKVLEVDIKELMPNFDLDLINQLKRKKTKQVQKGNVNDKSSEKLDHLIDSF